MPLLVYVFLALNPYPLTLPIESYLPVFNYTSKASAKGFSITLSTLARLHLCLPWGTV